MSAPRGHGFSVLFVAALAATATVVSLAAWAAVLYFLGALQ